MKRYSPVLLTLVCLGLMGTAGWARNIIAVPPAGSGTITVVSPDLAVLGNMLNPPAPYYYTALGNGSKYIVVSKSAAQSIIFARSPLNVAPILPIQIGYPINAAELTPDSKYLVTVADTVHIFDTATELEIQPGNILMGGAPTDVAISPDGKYAYVLTSNLSTITVVDIATASVKSTVTVPQNSTAIAVSPAGQVFVSFVGKIIEYNPDYKNETLTQRQEIGPLTGTPDKLQFTPDLKYALARNLSPGGTAVMIIDAITRSAIGSVSITAPGGGTVSVDRLHIIGNNRAVAYSSSLLRLYNITFPAISVTDLTLTNVGVADNVSGAVFSGELPTPRYLYLMRNGQIDRYDLTANQINLTQLLSFTGQLHMAGPAATGTPATMQIFNNNISLRPGAYQLVAVRLLNSLGQPLLDVPVTFSPSNGTILKTGSTIKSDRHGIATAVVEMPASAGTANLEVIAGEGTPLRATYNFTVFDNTGGGGGGGGGSSSGNLIRISGEGQLTNGFGAAPLPATLLALDNEGKPIADMTVNWTAGMNASLPSNAQTKTDAKGRSSIMMGGAGFLGPLDPYVKGTVTANTPMGSLSFNLIVIPFAQPVIYVKAPNEFTRTLTVKAGQTLVGAIQAGVGSPITQTVPQSVAIPGVGLELQVLGDETGPTARCKDWIAVGDAKGQISCDLVAGPVTGTVPITYTIGGLQSQILTLEVLPGDPSRINIVDGDAQTAQVGTTLPKQLVVSVTDINGNPLAGIPLNWTPGSAAGITIVSAATATDNNGQGRATVRFGNVGGSQTVRVTSGTMSATFNLTATVPISNLVYVSGNGQGPIVAGQRFPNPLVVQVNNQVGQPVANIGVTFAVSSGAATLGDSAAGTLTVTTGADGRASVLVNSGSPAGTIVVTASVPTLTPISFTLTTRPPGPDVTAAGFSSFVTNSTGLVQGSYGVLTGKGIASTITGAVFANLLAPSLPTTMQGLTITFNNNTSLVAPIYAMVNISGVERVVFLVPWEVPTGTATITVTVNNGSTTVTGVPIRSLAPAVMTTDGNVSGPVFAIREDGSQVSAAAPAKRGEKIVVYMVGLGQTVPALRTNSLAPANAAVQGQMAMAFGTSIITLPNAGFASRQFQGIYTVEVTIPTDAPIGSAVPFGVQFVPTGTNTPMYAQDGLTLAISN